METVVFTNRVPSETHAVGKFNFCRSFRVVKPRAAGAGQPFLLVEWQSFLPHLLYAFPEGQGSEVGGSSRSCAGGQSRQNSWPAADPHPEPTALLRGKRKDAGGPPTQLLRPVLTSRKIDMPLDSCRAELSSSEELLEDGDVSRESSILPSPGGGRRSGLGGRTGSGKGAAAMPRGSGSRAGVRSSAPPGVSLGSLPLRAPTRSCSRLPLPPAAGAGSVSSLHLATAAPLAGSGVWPPHHHWPPPETTPSPRPTLAPAAGR